MTAKDPKQPTISFSDRYASDQEFRKQVDEGRKRATEKRTTEALKKSLSMPKRREKLY